MIKIIREKIFRGELEKFLGHPYSDMIKFVADVDQEILVLGGELHVDAEKVLLRPYFMRQFRLIFLFLWLLPINATWAQKPAEEILSGAGRGEAKISIPKDYGRLISVVESGGIHYLYFQDDDGNIRIFMLGVKGSASRARIDLEALPHTVYLIPRSETQKSQSQTLQ